MEVLKLPRNGNDSKRQKLYIHIASRITGLIKHKFCTNFHNDFESTMN